MNKYTDWIEKEKFKEKIERKRWEECSGAGEYRNGKADAYEDVLNIIDQLDKAETLSIDKERLIKRIKNYIPLHDKTIGDVVDGILEIVKELPEMEVLSPEWIKDNTQLDMNPTSRVVPAFLLENLLVPKQEEVDRAYKDGYEKGKEYTFYKGYLEGLADKESEPEKVVVPQIVAEWYEENKKDLEYEIYLISNHVSAKSYGELNEMEAWFNKTINKPIETLIRMKLFGYDIEKEKLYYIKFSENQYAQKFDETKFDSMLINEESLASKFTEEEIKKMNPNLMALAVEATE